MADQLAELFVKFSVQGDEFKTALKDMGMEISDTEKKTSIFGNVLESLGTKIIAAFGVYKLYGYAKDILEVGIAMDSLKTSMEVSTGSAMAGASAMAFLKTESERLGLVFLDNVKSFQSLSAAASTSTLTMDQTKLIWTSVATAGAALKLSTDQMNGAFMALQQMISKGTVSAEEMRQQLGERLPGAFALAAQAMNMTTQEFGKAMEQGKIYADDFLPKLAAKLIEVYGEAAVTAAGSAQAAINRFHNASDALKIQMASDLLPTFTKVTVAATDFLKMMAGPKETEVLAQMLESINRQLAFYETNLGKAAEAWEQFWGRGDVDRLQELKSQLEFRIKMINDHTQEADKSWRWENDAAAIRRTEKEAAEEASLQKKLDLIAIELDAQKDLNAELIALDKKLWDEKQKIVAASALEIVADIRGMADQSTIEVEDFANSFVADIRAMSATTETLVGSMATDVVGDIRGIGTAATTATEDMASAMVTDIRRAGTGYSEFFTGVKVGLDDLIAKETTWSAAGTKIIKDMATASRNSMSDLFFDAMSGDLKSFGDYWGTFWSGLKRSTADILSSMATDWLTTIVQGFFTPSKSAAGSWAGDFSQLVMDGFSGISSAFSGYGGSLVSAISGLGSSLASALSGLFSFHEGAWLIPGEMLAVLQEGEMVIPKALAELVRPILEAIAGSGVSDVFNSMVGAVQNFDASYLSGSLSKFAGYIGGESYGAGAAADYLMGETPSVLGDTLGSISQYGGEIMAGVQALMGFLKGDYVGGISSGIGGILGAATGVPLLGTVVGRMLQGMLGTIGPGPEYFSLGELAGYTPNKWAPGVGMTGPQGFPGQPTVFGSTGHWYDPIANTWISGVEKAASEFSQRALPLAAISGSNVNQRLSGHNFQYWQYGDFPALNPAPWVESSVLNVSSFYQDVLASLVRGQSLPQVPSYSGYLAGTYNPDFWYPTSPIKPPPPPIQPGQTTLIPGNAWTWTDEASSVHAIDPYTGLWAQQTPMTDYGGFGYSKGTGLGGLPRTGSYYGHQGEIVLNPSESAMVRSGGGNGGNGGTTHIHVEIDGKEMMRLLVRNADKSPEWSSSIGRIVRRYTH